MARTETQADMFANRLLKRQKHLKKWARRTGAGAYLLYDRDIPEVPLKVEYYPSSDPGPGGALGMSLYRRPYEKGEDDENAWLEAMKAAAASALCLDPADIFLRMRERQRGPAQYGRLSDTGARATREVREYGIRYRVNLSAYLDTGLFLDRRLFRARIRSEAAGLRILNLFCYTASLSVAAAAGGAARVDSVDLSNTYLDRARENFAVNGLYPQKEEPFRFIRADALKFIDGAKGRAWDMIILDPPAFSNSKSMMSDFDLKRDHPVLVSRCLRLLEDGGTLYLSAAVNGFKLNGEKLSPGPRGRNVDIEDITEKLRDEDFTGRRIPATYRITRRPPVRG
ncbi:MAG: class I SAM-dependent methyltransferase [Treponema sp.]|jgi:23S rRNA G2069 N7-methylase RlmK/C1962 C5-methylase RlmI|nr:class I SAM-dependent methyltransferase [Treponema sp.]